MEKADIGVIGLGVMGQMLAFNFERHGYRVAGQDLDSEKVEAFDNQEDRDVVGVGLLNEFVDALKTPRRIMMMVPAGDPVDAVINEIMDLLEPGDLLIDGGNTHFSDTERRCKALEDKDIHYIGTGVSGGQYGALWGPSIMPGGTEEGWEIVRPLFEAAAAKVRGEPCVAYMGPRGAGHYVKMVHNGIEYAVMQLIAEVYDVLHRGVGLEADELHRIFTEWNAGELSSYLVGITADIFAEVDDASGDPLIEVILDEAKQKGTGKWTSQDALDLGVPTPTINAAVEARIISAYREERIAASEKLSGPKPVFDGDADAFVDMMRDALYAAEVCAYAQGFALLREASDAYDYRLVFSEIAKIWRGGCIIRAAMLEDIMDVFTTEPDLTNLLMTDHFGEIVASRQQPLRRVVEFAITNGIPVPAFASVIAYFDAYRTARLPANLTQAQRDYFGAHTYRQLNKKGQFHTEWVDMEMPPDEQ